MSTTTLVFHSQRLQGRQDPSSAWRRNQNTIAFSRSKNLGPVAHTVLVAIMLAVLGLIYLTQVTKTSTYAYQLNDLETKRTALADQKQDLEVENARLQALERVQKSDVAKAMTSPTEVNYASQVN